MNLLSDFKKMQLQDEECVKNMIDGIKDSGAPERALNDMLIEAYKLEVLCGSRVNRNYIKALETVLEELKA